MARAGERAVVWDRPELRALCPPGAVGYDAPDAGAHAGGSRFSWQRARSSYGSGAHNALNAAGALTAAALAGAEPGPAVGRDGQFPGGPATARAGGGDGDGGRGIRRLRPPPDRGGGGDRGARTLVRAGWSPSSSPTSTPGPARWPAGSARRWPQRTRSRCSACIRRGSGPRTFPGVDGALVAEAAADAGGGADGGLAAGVRGRPDVSGTAPASGRPVPGDGCRESMSWPDRWWSTAATELSARPQASPKTKNAAREMSGFPRGRIRRLRKRPRGRRLMAAPASAGEVFETGESRHSAGRARADCGAGARVDWRGRRPMEARMNDDPRRDRSRGRARSDESRRRTRRCLTRPAQARLSWRRRTRIASSLVAGCGAGLMAGGWLWFRDSSSSRCRRSRDRCQRPRSRGDPVCASLRGAEHDHAGRADGKLYGAVSAYPVVRSLAGEDPVPSRDADPRRERLPVAMVIVAGQP